MKAIFHHAGFIGSKPSASSLRPHKVLNALRNLDIDVTLIDGSLCARREKMKLISKSLKFREYDFVYVENSSTPITLRVTKIFGKTIPVLNLYDLYFLFLCRLHNIPIGYFFRDIYWDFPETFGGRISKKKLWTLKIFGWLELKFIKVFASKVYVPNEDFGLFLKEKYKVLSTPLPPGCDINCRDTLPQKGVLKLFYIGGCGPVYNPQVFFDGLRKLNRDVELTYCTRADEWAVFGQNYKISNNINVIHESGDAALKLLLASDICVHTLPPSPYSKMAFPYKISEYLGCGKPMIVFKGTYPSKFVIQNNVGWACEYSAEGVYNVIKEIMEDVSIIKTKTENAEKIRNAKTWEELGKLLVTDLAQRELAQGK